MTSFSSKSYVKCRLRCYIWLKCSGIDMDPSQAPSHYKGLANKNIQSYSFKMLQKALEGGMNITMHVHV